MVVLMAGCFRWVKRRNQTKEIKLVIIGLDNAGKTTTIACLQGEPPDGIAPTVGFSNANLTMGRWNITVYDLGGGENVRSVWPKYYAEVYGMIFAVDAGDHNRLVESKNVLNEIFTDPKVSGKPVVVFANKQDKDGAFNEEEVSKQLALQELSKQHNFKYNIFSCSAIQGYGKKTDKRIKSGLEWLLNSIKQDYSVINEKVTKESAIQMEQERKERKERFERIKKIREEREKAEKEAGVHEEESDDDATANPFRSIGDQVEITQRREKKAKEKKKKLKEYQMKMNDGDKSGDQDKKQIGDESTNLSKDDKLNLHSRLVNDDVENDDGTIIESPRHCIIQVSSKDNIREVSPKKKKKIKKLNDDNLQSNMESSNNNLEDVSVTDNLSRKHSRKKKKVLENHSNNYCINESLSDFKIEKDINDSRAELFLARSSESLEQREHIDSNCCNNKGREKAKLSAEFHDVQRVRTEVKKEKRKKTNRTEPKLSSSSIENNLSNGSLPPLRAARKLPPL